MEKYPGRVLLHANVLAISPIESMTITDDLQKLLDILPQDLRQVLESHPKRDILVEVVLLESHPKRDILVEVVLDLGRRPEARFPNQAEYLSEVPVTQEQIDDCIQRVGIFGGDNRAGIEQTLHRISAIRNRTGKIIGLTCRVGRAVFGTIGMIRDLVETGKSILMLGRPGVGKTTALREIARVLADDLHKRVVIIDTSNEIAGDGDVAHPAIGRARRMQVAHPDQQHQVMIEAVENHMPEVIVIDEIGTELEALAARTIAERGVQLVGTAHGNQIENLIKNPTLADLVGGIQAVTLGDDEARRRGSQKTVLERKAPPTFEIAVEMLERQRWVVHESVADTVDNLLRGRQATPQTRTVDDHGKIAVTRQLAVVNGRGGQLGTVEDSFPPARPSNGWRSSGQMVALPQLPVERVTGRSEFDRLLDESFNYSESIDFDTATRVPGPNGEDLPLHVYPYGVSRHQLEQVISVLTLPVVLTQVISVLTLPVVLTKDIDSADAILALRSHVKNHAKLRQMAKARHVPIHMIKSSTIPQITRGLRRLLNIDDPEMADDRELQLFLHNGSDDEMDALEEAR